MGYTETHWEGESMARILPKSIENIVNAVMESGGRPFIVGGAVRDRLLGAGLPSKDVDFEVYGISAKRLIATLEPFGRVETVGSSFGVIKLWMGKGLELDFALPRRESKTGRGHRGFIVAPDPEMTPEEACARRDFTMNAMLMDPLTGEIFDYYGGRRDMERKILRHTSGQFVEDPLRALRGMQFAGRFELTVHPDTAKICRTMVDEASTLARERIYGEWEKWALLSTRPSAGLEVVREMGWSAVFPGLDRLIGVEQDPVHHPEGDVWRHTLEAVDAASRIAKRDQLRNPDALTLIFAALCHDLGKPSTTSYCNDGRIVSKGHAVEGGALASELLDEMGAPKAISERVIPLVREHTFCFSTENISRRAARRLADRLRPETIEMLIRLVEADQAGRCPPGEAPWIALETAAKAVGAYREPPKPLLLGRDLIALGQEPGKRLGLNLKIAYEAQLEGAFENREEALVWAAREWPGEK